MAKRRVKPHIRRIREHAWAEWVVTHPKAVGFAIEYWFSYHATFESAAKSAKDTHVNWR